MSLTVDQKQELIRWLESAEWWPELPYAALEAKLKTTEIELEALIREQEGEGLPA